MNGSAPLTGAQYEQLVQALAGAFPQQIDLAMMLMFRLTKTLDWIAPPGNTVQRAFYLVQASEAEGWTADLVEAARKSRPRNAQLLTLAQSIGAPTSVPGTAHLQRIIRETNQFHDIVKWREAMAAIETQVCRIVVRTNKGHIFGTGFLVGPDVVMTNYHVVEAVLAGERGQQTEGGRTAKAADVICQFDYKRLAGYLNQGIEVKLASDWLIDSSPMSPIDAAPEPKPGVPSDQQLDYALLRLARPLGSEPIKAPGESAEPQADPRGWIAVPKSDQTFEKGTPIFIVQHPEGDPLVFTMDTVGVRGVNGNGSRVTYTTNTLPGSSGSPCFDQDWQLVALHHSGDPNFDPLTKPEYNEGIPMKAIRALLRTRGLERQLDTMHDAP